MESTETKPLGDYFDNYPRITILLVVLNGAKSIKQLLRSIESQTYPNIEFVMVDGGSTDSTIAIFENWQCGTIDKKVICNPHEKNIVDSYRIGFQAASGKYITMIGHDDYYFNVNWLSIAVQKLEQMPNPYSFTWGRAICLNSSEEIISITPDFSEIIPYGDLYVLHTLVTGKLPNDISVVMTKEDCLKYFPTVTSSENDIYIPHAVFLINLLIQGYQSIFVSIIATGSTGLDLDTRRQIRFAKRERKAYKLLLWKFRKYFFYQFIKIDHSRFKYNRLKFFKLFALKFIYYLFENAIIKRALYKIINFKFINY